MYKNPSRNFGPFQLAVPLSANKKGDLLIDNKVSLQDFMKYVAMSANIDFLVGTTHLSYHDVHVMLAFIEENDIAVDAYLDTHPVEDTIEI